MSVFIFGLRQSRWPGTCPYTCTYSSPSAYQYWYRLPSKLKLAWACSIPPANVAKSSFVLFFISKEQKNKEQESKIHHKRKHSTETSSPGLLAGGAEWHYFCRTTARTSGEHGIHSAQKRGKQFVVVATHRVCQTLLRTRRQACITKLDLHPRCCRDV